MDDASSPPWQNSRRYRCAPSLRPILAATLLLALPSAARAAKPCAVSETTAPCDCIKVWSVSTHGLTACQPGCVRARDEATHGLRVETWDDCRRWQPAELAELLASDTCAAPTCIYIHGYNNSEADAREAGLAVYQALAGAGDDAGRLRLIVWMWPSEKTGENSLESFRTIADVAEQQAAHLAEFLATLPDSGDMVLWGHSYGARLATAALHLLGGGELCGTALEEKPAGLCCLRAVLTAAALDNDWLLPGQRYACALSATRRMLVLASPADPVLKRYNRLRPGEFSAALGSTGMNVGCLAAHDVAKVRQVNVSGLIGVAHVSKRYLRSFGVVDMIRGEILREQAVAPPRWTGNAVGRGPQHSTAR